MISVLRNVLNGKRTRFCGIIVCSEGDSKAGVWDCGLRIADCGSRIDTVFNLNFESASEQIHKSAIRNPQSAVRNPQSAIRNPQSAIRNPRRVESRDVLPYPNSAFEAGPIYFFPNALRRSFDAPQLFIIFVERRAEIFRRKFFRAINYKS